MWFKCSSLNGGILYRQSDRAKLSHARVVCPPPSMCVICDGYRDNAVFI